MIGYVPGTVLAETLTLLSSVFWKHNDILETVLIFNHYYLLFEKQKWKLT